MVIRLIKKIKFCKSHDRKSLCVQHCFIKRYNRASLFSIEFYLHDVWFYQLRHRLHVCLRALKRKYIWSDLHFIVDEKVKILHFHDEDKSWWPSILYHSVANADQYLHILVWYTPRTCHWLFRAVNLYSFDF